MWTAALPAEAATPGDLVAARVQMAFSLGWHIVLACFGVGLPGLAVFAEWRGLRTGDQAWDTLAVTAAAGDPAVLAPVVWVLGIGALLLVPSLVHLFTVLQRGAGIAGNMDTLSR